MAFFSPVTTISNHTDDVLLIQRNAPLGTRVIPLGVIKVIPPGGHVDFGYRKGMGSAGDTFLVQPESRPGVPGKDIFPIQLFNYASIDVLYKSVGGSVLREYEDGAFLDFDFKDTEDTLFRRIGLVKWLAGVFAAFGNCYSAARSPAEALPAVGQVTSPSPDGIYFSGHRIRESPSMIATGETSDVDSTREGRSGEHPRIQQAAKRGAVAKD